MWLPKVHTWSKKWRSSTPVCKVISTERSPVYWFLNDSAIFQLQANNQVPFFADLQRKNFFYLRSLLVIVIIIPAHSGQGIIIEIFRRVPEERHQWWNLHFDGKREACRWLPVRYRSRSKRKKPFFFAGEEKFINEINPAERFWWTTPVSKIFSGGNKKFAIELPIFTRIPWLNRLFKREIQIENQVECDILSRLMAVHE